MPLIAFNLLFIDRRPLSGPGYYAVRVFEEAVHLVRSKPNGVHLIAYVQKDALKHIPPHLHDCVGIVPVLSSTVLRVLFEQIVFPLQTRKAGVDLLFSPGFVSPLWGSRRKVVTICDMYYRAIPKLISRFQRAYWSVGIPATSRVCDRIITISQHSRRDIERYLPAARGKTISIPLASRFEAGKERDVGEQSLPVELPPYLLMVANLTANKNCEVVVEAVSAINKRRRDAVRFVHAGSDPYGLLRESVGRNQAEGFVSSLGKVSDSHLSKLYRNCLAVVTPSLYEGFGMPALEAQSMGAPLISSDRAALPEVAGSAALYFDPESRQELESQIEAVLDMGPRAREDLVIRSLQNAASFSWSVTAEKTLEVFMEVLGVQRPVRGQP